MRRVFLSVIACLGFWTGTAQVPAGYYDAASGLSGKVLQQTLHDIIDGHRIIPYDSLYFCFRRTDVKNDSVVWDMYSDKPGENPPYFYCYGKGQECGNYKKEADCYNREHAFPKSWSNDLAPMNSDLFHIYPTDGYVNNRRSNYPFGETSAPSWKSENGSKLGPSSWPGYSGTVFEPIDDYKGDFARTCFYMACRYFGEDGTWKGSDMVTGAEPKPWAIELLLDWHHKDTVCAKETDRNNQVYHFQKNRNPFIDHPLFADMIWGKQLVAVNLRDELPEPELYPNPASDYLMVKLTGQICLNAEIFIWSITGISADHQKATGGITRLDIGKLRPGLYIVRIVTSGVAYNASFVKVGK